MTSMWNLFLLALSINLSANGVNTLGDSNMVACDPSLADHSPRIEIGKRTVACARIIEEGKEEPEASVERARPNHSLGKQGQAIADLTKPIEHQLDLQNYETQCNTHALNGAFKSAISHCLTARKIGAGKNVHKKLGMIRFIIQDYERAIADFKRWKKADTTNREATAWIHMALVRDGGADPVHGLNPLIQNIRKGDAKRSLLESLLQNTQPSPMKDHGLLVETWQQSLEYLRRIALDRELLEFLRSDRLSPHILASFDSCSATFYVGQWHILRARLEDARAALEKAVKSLCDQSSELFLVARADLDHLDEVVNMIQTNKQRRDADELNHWKVVQGRITRFRQKIEDQKIRLGRDGRSYFSFGYQNSAMGYDSHGCLIGDDGKVYVYDYRVSDELMQNYEVGSSDLSRALDLSNRLKVDKISSPTGRAFDLGFGSWVVRNRTNTAILKVLGNTWGELDNPIANELVQFINKWCESTKRVAIIDRILSRPKKSGN